MNTKFKTLFVAGLAALVLSGCGYHHGGYGYRDYDRGGSYASSVEEAEDLRSRVLNSRPVGGEFTNRTFNNSVSAGSNSWRYQLDGRGQGVIPGR